MKRMISGIKPTSFSPTLGNYLGAIKQFIKYQDSTDLFVFIADLHALTLYITPDELKQNVDNLIAIYLAAGLDPNKCTIFKQSMVPAHSQLEWILTCNTQLPDLLKMPQYKKYIANTNAATPAGMLMYPSLMNADILLYQADCVPVGLDQKPHIDLTKDVANRFNSVYGDTFRVPESVIADTGAKIMSLSDPTKKMSKSEPEKGTIYLLEDLESVRKKIMKAKTDSDGTIKYDPVNKPGISNLLTIFSCLSSTPIPELERIFANNPDYGTFKKAVADLVCAELAILQQKVSTIKQDTDYISNILAIGTGKANLVANETLQNIYKKIGLI